METWLDHWERTFKEAQQIKLPEVADNRALYDFATAIASINSNYACAIEFDINWAIKLGTTILTLSDLIKDYRNHWRRKEVSTSPSDISNTASAHFKGDHQKKQNQRCQCNEEHQPSDY